MNMIGVGADIVECLRIAQMIERHGEGFLTRVFTAHEIAFCASRKTATQHYAARWATKEAFLKAIGANWSRGIRWRDIEIRQDAEKGPTLVVSGGAKQACDRLGVGKFLISLSYCRSHAVGYVIALARDV